MILEVSYLNDESLTVELKGNTMYVSSVITLKKYCKIVQTFSIFIILVNEMPAKLFEDLVISVFHARSGPLGSCS